MNTADLLGLFCKVLPWKSRSERLVRALVDFFVWSVTVMAVTGALLNTPEFVRWVSMLFLPFAVWWQKGCGTFEGMATGALTGVLLALMLWR